MFTERQSRQPSLADQVVYHYLDGLDMSNRPQEGVDVNVRTNTGHVMASLIDMGHEEQFREIVEGLATQPDYLASSLAHGLVFKSPRILQAMMSGLDTIDPDTLDLSTRIEVMAAITGADARSETPLNKAWQNVSLDTQAVFDEVFGQELFGSTLYNLFCVQPFTEFSEPESYIKHLTKRCLDFMRSEDADGSNLPGSPRPGHTVFDTVLSTPNLEELLEQKKEFLQAVVKIPQYKIKVVEAIENGLIRRETSALLLFDVLQESLPENKMHDLECRRVTCLAHVGRIKEALELAEDINTFESRASALCESARYLHEQDMEDEAERLLRQALELNPDDFMPDPYIPPSLQDKSNKNEIQFLAVQMGNYDLALEAHIEESAPKNPYSRVVQEIIKQRDIIPFLESLGRSDLKLLQRTRLLNGLMTGFLTRQERAYSNNEDTRLQQVLDEAARKYANELEELTAIGKGGPSYSRYTHAAAELLALADQGEEALVAQRKASVDKVSHIAGKIILSQASRGNTAQAINTYLRSDSRIDSKQAVGKQALSVLLTNALLREDYASARIVASELPASERTDYFSSAVLREGSEIPTAPQWVVNAVTTGDIQNAPWPTYVNILASALRNAHLMPVR